LIIAFLYIFAIVVFTSSEDRALLGSNPSAEAGGLSMGAVCDALPLFLMLLSIMR